MEYDLTLEALIERLRSTSEVAGVVQGPDLLRSALSRPHNKWHYEDPRPDLFVLAAAYCFGIVKDHPLVDGNKRIGYAVATLFLEENGIGCDPPDQAIVRTMVDVADGKTDETALAGWFRRHSSTA